MRALPRPLVRAAVGLAAVATVIGVSASPAAADNTYHPAESDFADCPAKPADAQGTWTCYVMTTVGGVVRLDKMSANLTAPWRLTVAQGQVTGGAKIAKVGGLSADPVPFVSGVPGTPFVTPHPTGWKLQPYATGHVTPGLTIPASVGVKIRIIGTGLGETCYVGGDTTPIVIKPKVSWWLPWLFDATPMIKTQVYDDVYSLGAASGCSNAATTFTVNTLIGLPANATSNYAQFQWALRHKTY
ncbi:hypothetical protein ACRYCC_08435 [Actinomadura scrupuli]|uniref:hypothetical protein n=1 Tax=Actinomadura scrupuli TaxID=559629 RepID=UPI003D99A1F9